MLYACMQILASIGQLEFFYDQAPDVMRSCSMALQLLSVCIGSYLSGALVWAVGRFSVGVAGAKRGWLPNDLNHGRVDLFFLLLAGAHRSSSLSPPLPYLLTEGLATDDGERDTHVSILICMTLCTGYCHI